MAELSELVVKYDDLGISVDSEEGRGAIIDSLAVQHEGHFRYREARVVSMTTNRMRNFMILDRGAEEGIAPDMGVVTPNNELVGYVVSCSSHYCVVQPMLNVEFSTGGRLVDNDHVCMIIWSGNSKYRVEAQDISVYPYKYHDNTGTTSVVNSGDDQVNITKSFGMNIRCIKE